MPTDRKRVHYLPVEQPLAVLGYSLEHDGNTLIGTGPARRLALLVERARETVEFTRSEWNILYAALAPVIEDFPMSENSARSIIVAQLLTAVSQGVKAARVMDRVQRCSDLQAEAILCAVRWAWRNRDSWDAEKDEWWKT